MAQQKSQKSKDESSLTDLTKLFLRDHKKIKKLFKEFQNLDVTPSGQKGKKNSRKAELVRQLCIELSIHAQAEEEIFYPAVREAIAGQGATKEQELMDEVDVENTVTKEFIAQLQCMRPVDRHYDAKVRVLSKYVKHHAKEVKGKIIPMIQGTKFDLQRLGGELSKFKDERKEAKKPVPPKKASTPTGEKQEVRK